jgi:GntR family transcriptional regulator
MFIVINQNNPEPLYKQITDQIKNAVASGEFKDNEKLPSIREMTKELKISQITIKRAYADLEREGYIITRAGMGSFIAGINRNRLKEEKLSQIEDELDKIISSAAKYGITKNEIKSLIDERKED